MMSSALSGSGQLKRKRTEPSTPLSGTDIDNPIVLQAAGDENDPNAPRVEFILKFLLPREYLSFAFTKCDRDNQPRLFHSHVSVLEEAASRGVTKSAQVVIAASTIDGAVYAIERVEEGLYGVCPLPDWTLLDEVDNKPAKRVKSDVLKPHEPARAGTPWWDRAAVSRPHTVPRPQSATTSHSLPKHRSKSSPRDVSLPQKSEPKPCPDLDTTNDESPAQAPNAEEEPNVALSLEEVAVALRTKYLEALYISKTSLAYFAKGPLARARNLLQHSKGDQTAGNILTVLEEMTLTISMNDRKYSSTLSDLLKEIPVGFLDDDDQDAAKQSANIRKKGRKRKKISKGGLLPSEEEHVLVWWQEKEKSAEPANADITQAERIKASLAKQRTRETQLQIMLILEAMIAEKAAKEAAAAAENVAIIRTTDQDAAGKKAKKPDLQALLDMHVDRLCIWQTTQNGFDIVDGPRPRSSLKSADKSNALQDFCTEVLVPFFASRIPRTFSQLCKKMGTIGVTSPVRPVPQKAAATAQGHPKPGAAVSRRGLQRVATEGSGIAKQVPSLSRSATDSSAMRMKREDSVLSLDDIPTHRPRPQPNLRYTHREVDLDALNKATESKLKRKALVEQELRSAINVLKKPNSRMAVKEYVDFSEDRTKQKSKRKRDPVHLASQSPLVKVTPRARRVIQSLPRDEERENDTLPVPRSNEQVVPSSSQRLDVSKLSSGRLAYNGDNEISVEATPSRRSSRPLFSLPDQNPFNRSMPSGSATQNPGRLDPSLLVEDTEEQERRVIGVSPIAARRSNQVERSILTPTKPRAHNLMPPPFRVVDTIAATPVKITRTTSVVATSVGAACSDETKAGPPTAVVEAAQIVEEEEEEEEEIDVYKALGWDDEDDDLM